MRKKYPISTILATLAIILVIVSIVYQTKKDAINKTPEAQLIKRIMPQSISVEKIIKDGPKNISGVVLRIDQKSKKPQKSIAFIYNKNNLLIGNLFDSNAKNLTLAYSLKYTIKAIPKEQLANDLKRTSLITQGSINHNKQITVIIDPNCPYCHLEFKTLQPYIKANKITVNWLVVGVIKLPSSEQKAQSILSAKDPLQALIYNENLFSDSGESGGVTIDKFPINSKGVKATKQNNKFFTKYQLSTVPNIIYLDKNGEIVILKSYLNKEKIEKLIKSLPETQNTNQL